MRATEVYCVSSGPVSQLGFSVPALGRPKVKAPAKGGTHERGAIVAALGGADLRFLGVHGSRIALRASGTTIAGGS